MANPCKSNMGNLITKVYYLGTYYGQILLFLSISCGPLISKPQILPEVNGAAGADEDSSPHGQGRVGDPSRRFVDRPGKLAPPNKGIPGGFHKRGYPKMGGL